jgi:hypothetical protein
MDGQADGRGGQADRGVDMNFGSPPWSFPSIDFPPPDSRQIHMLVVTSFSYGLIE